MKKINLLLVVLLIVCIGKAQNPEWIGYTNRDAVLAIVEDNSFLWIGTNGGLVKLDKNTENLTFYNTSNSGLPNNYVYSIAIDVQGNKWIGTWGSGLSVFNETGVELSIKENQPIRNNINIFPNPTSDYFNIESLSKMNIIAVEIMNIQGRLIENRVINKTKQTIDISNLPSGVYILKIQTEKGFETKKIIKQ